mmetsp:Transcript_58946/g.164719  ORF Transcript_58946/g.164719 Transcript_58946/m.164719 type:complete len:306 (-) Transcript_58946:569-1486(-)
MPSAEDEATLMPAWAFSAAAAMPAAKFSVKPAPIAETLFAMPAAATGNGNAAAVGQTACAFSAAAANPAVMFSVKAAPIVDNLLVMPTFDAVAAGPGSSRSSNTGSPTHAARKSSFDFKRATSATQRASVAMSVATSRAAVAANFPTPDDALPMDSAPEAATSPAKRAASPTEPFCLEASAPPTAPPAMATAPAVYAAPTVATAGAANNKPPAAPAAPTAPNAMQAAVVFSRHASGDDGLRATGTAAHASAPPRERADAFDVCLAPAFAFPFLPCSSLPGWQRWTRSTVQQSVSEASSLSSADKL